MKRKISYWLLAILITLVAVIYQRMTGPTKPKRMKLEYAGEEYKIKFPRSHVSLADCPVELEIADKNLHATIEYRRYPSDDEWTKKTFERKDHKLVAYLPKQPPAGKVIYNVNILDAEDNVLQQSDMVIARFKGDVPAWALLPHVFIMFFAMLLSNLTGLLAIGKMPSFRLYTRLSFLFLLVGGMILGPVVQKFAFGEFWTGVPFGWDLTDNKTLVGFLAWGIAVIANWKKERPVYSIIAAVLLLLIYSVPHSMYGSELDYGTGEIGQG